MSRILIIGAGQTSGQAAASLRQEGFEGKITIFGNEPYPPYQRPPLSKQYLAGEQGLEKAYVRPGKFYADKDIDLRTDTGVSRIDRHARTVTTDGASTFAYDRLLIATGSRPRILEIPGSDLAGIHYLRTIADADAIREAMPSASKICIVGGGYIGLEVAAVATTAGLEVTVLEMEDRILQRVTTPLMSRYYHQLHSARGVDILVNTRCIGFEGEGRVERLLCGDKAFETDLVIIGIGVLPNVELAAAAGLECDDGIVVDDHCRTSDADIYAAGDCTNHPNPVIGRRLRLESVPNAMEQARVAAGNMLGGDRVYASVPWFWSDQYELKLQMMGFSADNDEAVIRGDTTDNRFAVFYFRDGVLVGVDAVNSPREFMVCKQLYGKAVDRDALVNPDKDLKTLLA